VQGRGVASKSRTKNTIIPAIYAVVKGIGLRKGQSFAVGDLLHGDKSGFVGAG